MIRLFKFSEVSPEDVFARVSPTAQVDGVVADIIADVRKRGDAALLDYTARFDGADPAAGFSTMPRARTMAPISSPPISKMP